MRLGLVHRQREAEAADAAPVAERAGERGAEGDGAILQTVMGVDLQVAVAGEREGEAVMRRDLIEHMVEEGDARVDAAGRSEEHTSELQSIMRISSAVLCLK